MPSRLFFELNDGKKKKIIEESLSEFAVRGYINASTNTIVKNAGISKGSLFKYFAHKEELYFYVLDLVTNELLESIQKEMTALSPELFQRVIDYSVLEFSWYIQNPIKSKLVIGAFTQSDTEIYHKTIKRYGTKESEIFYQLLENIDLQNFRWDKQKTTDILKWFLEGFNRDFLANAQTDSSSLEYLHNEYVQKLTEYMEVLKAGLIK